MKDSKISLLLLVSLSMLLLAFVVLFIWGFTYYKQSITEGPSSTIVIKDSSAIAGNIRDSLQKMYNATISKVYESFDSTARNTDSLQLEMDAKLLEFVTLKNEITAILQSSTSPSEINAAKAKLTDVQLKLEGWRIKYNDVNEENKRLSLLLNKLKQDPAGGTAALATKATPVVPTKGNSTTSKNVMNQQTALNDIKAVSPEKDIKSNTFLDVAGLQLKVVSKYDDLEKETQQALQADEIKGSVVVRNGQQSIKNAEIFIIVLQPDGKVIRQSSWESGLFETTQGRKIYSLKMRFDYNRAENKTLNFSISAEQYQKGIYILQVYYNGSLIGKTSKSLS